MSVIHMNRVQKSFGKFQALQDVSLQVGKGEVLGFIGPNGAGKSTTIRILLGLLRRDGGEMRLFGKDPWKDAVKLHRRLAYVPGDVHLWPNLTGGEVVDLFGRLRGRLDSKRRAQLLERFDLDPTKKCGTYSKGNRQKVALVAAFASEAELFILDEPTSGLDPLMEAVFQECVAEAKASGHTVLLSSHILAEVETLCDRISIIRKGKIVESGTLRDMRLVSLTKVSGETERPVTGLERLQGITELHALGAHFEFRVDNRELGAALNHLYGFGIKTLTSTPPSLEELFMRHYGDEASSLSASGTKKELSKK
ncbi:ABC transporter ATP-binding protein [Paenibacillus sp. YN15]|uniref:ABC transporter ATP-binding protein n=1 Tax=Paenibacillus sp. YN15 TaxID=1742774 RepID=UPI000DCEC3B7|nr:ABC transporter ATP-binding protein [Paenibacillus sp. YN15]RAV05043.1 ABC transporter ATP-binding protein [Paenibacillus sp. YN15]